MSKRPTSSPTPSSLETMSSSLPTPPRTVDRSDKENRPGSSGRVEWSSVNQYHSLSSPSKLHDIRSAFMEPPAKSILKRPTPSQPQLDTDTDAKAQSREATPEPETPHTDTSYLVSPVAAIVDPSATLHQLSEAYSILGARLRACIDEEDKPRSSWPIFTPIRENSSRLMECFIRDVGRALVDPVEAEEKSTILLPSPQNSPKKKRCMTSTQVTHARDLCTTAHCVLKLVGFLFAYHGIYGIFSDVDLRTLLTEILAIPLAPVLPTLYARKTCALAIWVIQSQRLTAEVLQPAADRIAYAIRRGIDGELGREGKKGSASDGLRAIHDLSVHLPDVFVPAFSTILPSILSSLLAPSAVLRIQACHALGGLAIASTNIEATEVHDNLAETVRDMFKACKSPAKSPSTIIDPPIVRTLRQSMSNDAAQNVAQGPVWSLSVLAHLALMLRSTVFDDADIRRIYIAMFTAAKNTSLRHIRALGAVAWRAVIWGCMQPRLEIEENSPSSTATSYLNFLLSYVELGCGSILTAGFLSGQCNIAGSAITQALYVMEVMAQRSSKSIREALGTIRAIIKDEQVDELVFDSNTILPASLFSANPGILTESAESLQSCASIFDMTREGFRVGDVPPIGKESIADHRVMRRIFVVWAKAAVQFAKCDPSLVKDIWSTWKVMLETFLYVEEEYGHFGPSGVIEMASDALKSVAAHDIPLSSPSIAKKTASWKLAGIRIQIVHDCWEVLAPLIRTNELEVGQDILAALMRQDHLVDGDDARREWAVLCASIAITCSRESLKAFWSLESSSDIPMRKWEWSAATRKAVWREFVEVWMFEGFYEGAIVLLGVPFMGEHAWELDENDFKSWEMLLAAGIGKALDYGVDAIQLVDSVAETIASDFDPTCTSAIKVVDILLSSLKEASPDARSVPAGLADFVNETLRTSYPPTPKQTMLCIWALRSLNHILQSWPATLSFDLLEKLQEGLVLWISDEEFGLQPETYSAEIATLYDAVLLCMGHLPQDSSTLEVFQPLVECVFLGRDDKPVALLKAFHEFWQESFGDALPSEEWPEQVRVHFGLVPSQSVVEEDADVIPEPSIGASVELYPEVPNIQQDESVVPTEVVEECQDVAPSFSRSDCSSSLAPGLFTPPPTSPLRSPPRQQRSPQFVVMSNNLETPSQCPRVSLFGSPISKRRRVSTDNKENEFYEEPFTPTRKRALADDAEEAPSPKKIRSEEDDVFSNPEHVSHLTSAFPSPPKFVRDVFLEPSPNVKRKFAAVEVPKLSATLKRRRSLDDDDREPVPSFKSLLKRDQDIAPKRAKTSFPVSKQRGRDPTSSSDEPSSDDSPYVGQVTPQHIVSPELARRRSLRRSSTSSLRLDSDPPSDDSEPSPTRSIVRRKGYTALNGRYWADVAGI